MNVHHLRPTKAPAVVPLPSSRGERLAALEQHERELYAIEHGTRLERTRLRDEILALRQSLTADEARAYERARATTEGDR